MQLGEDGNIEMRKRGHRNSDVRIGDNGIIEKKIRCKTTDVPVFDVAGNSIDFQKQIRGQICFSIIIGSA